MEFQVSRGSIDGADVLRDPQSEVMGSADDDEEIAPDGSCIQVPVAAPEPPQPRKAEVERHNLTHIHYRSWCPHCAYGRNPAANTDPNKIPNAKSLSSGQTTCMPHSFPGNSTH